MRRALLLAAASAACSSAAAPATALERFTATPVPPERSAIRPTTVEPDAAGRLVVRGGFFVPGAGYALEPALAAGPGGSRVLEVRAVRRGEPSAGVDAASHFDYTAVLPARVSGVVVVHRISGSMLPADTVFPRRGR